MTVTIERPQLVVTEPDVPVHSSWLNLLARRVERHRLLGEDVAFSVHRFDQDFVLSKRHAHQDDGVALTVIRPRPRQVVDGDVQVPDPRRHVACSRPTTGRMRKFSTRYG